MTWQACFARPNLQPLPQLALVHLTFQNLAAGSLRTSTRTEVVANELSKRKRSMTRLQGECLYLYRRAEEVGEIQMLVKTHRGGGG